MLRLNHICAKFAPTIRQKSTNVLELLNNRSLIQVAGNEVADFLQGLITNDINHLNNGNESMYAMFLNTKGRVMYDTLVYKGVEPNCYLLECDSEIVQSLQKHLKLYRVRRKIDIKLLDDSCIYALFDADQSSKESHKSKVFSKHIGDISIYQDPRIIALGLRVVAPKGYDVLGEISNGTDVKLEQSKYREFRYHLGVGEGVTDLPPGNCLPLEANCDYLHGVSFHKGCYIGQELTARTHHTGVVRKRLMPIHLDKPLEDIPEEKNIVLDKVNLGKFRGSVGCTGLALLRIAQAIECQGIPIGNSLATTGKPTWWPLEAPKEKMSA
ncbi:PREDICTED: putative transferase CAF17 homolog, mitochondrial isoform X2 [Nicrophorus vespilloides]|uniref:Transferase CAF17 homolog, mitochondrial isoform X2 n=1 Tax=Nicrophorus vespilloides TaxID=110193 RepID=A0ABM1M9Y9_NICVS|nr:PREDICTED: putative transferase CAF17 homolog, mitochondrial isoform X2 [Nicrophorus vespilloides]